MSAQVEYIQSEYAPIKGHPTSYQNRPKLWLFTTINSWSCKVQTFCCTGRFKFHTAGSNRMTFQGTPTRLSGYIGEGAEGL